MYVVAGAVGNTGKVIVDTLLEEKQAVRAIVRKEADGPALRAKGVEVVVLDLDDAAALTKALTGAKGAYLLLPPQMASENARADNARRTAAYVKAIDGSGIPHVVLLSSVGAQHQDGTGPIATLHDAEVALGSSRAAVTFLRASYFMENWGGSLYGLAQGELPTFLTADRVIPMVASEDIGRTAAKLLIEGGQGKSIVELSGPKDYSPNDVAAALGRVTGKSIKAAFGPEEYIVPALTGAGMNAHWAGLYREMIHGVNAGHVDFERKGTRAVRGTTDVEVVLKSLTAPKK